MIQMDVNRHRLARVSRNRSCTVESDVCSSQNQMAAPSCSLSSKSIAGDTNGLSQQCTRSRARAATMCVEPCASKASNSSMKLSRITTRAIGFKRGLSRAGEFSSSVCSLAPPFARSALSAVGPSVTTRAGRALAQAHVLSQ